MRLFVAILLDDQVRSVLQRGQAALGRSCDGVRWVRSDQLHITLKFLGDVPDLGAAKASEALVRAAQTVHPFEMTLEKTGCFPPRGNVRIVWAGATEPSGTLARCAEAVENELAQLGHPKERRPFSPHVTIGRVREDRSGGQLRDAVEEFSFDRVVQAVDRLTLMSSVLSPKGPTYSMVSEAVFGAGC